MYTLCDTINEQEQDDFILDDFISKNSIDTYLTKSSRRKSQEIEEIISENNYEECIQC